MIREVLEPRYAQIIAQLRCSIADATLAMADIAALVNDRDSAYVHPACATEELERERKLVVECLTAATETLQEAHQDLLDLSKPGGPLGDEVQKTH